MFVPANWFWSVLLVSSSTWRAAKTVVWDEVLPQTAIQDVNVDNEHYSRGHELQETLYRPDFNAKLADGCIADCQSQIYCHGEILHDVEMARIYPDSKTFVDKKLLYSEEAIVTKYRTLKKQTNKQLTIEQLKTFIDENFADDPFEPWTPSDLNPTPTVVKNIADGAYRKWALELNQIWKELAQKVPDDVFVNPDRHSYLYIPNGFIKAGGRFREMYYWDSYWVIRGLLLCDMLDTARGIVENMIYLVKQYGHVPNGNRKYYLQRSQPPLLIQMAATYHSASKNDKFIEDNVQYFDLEFQYWWTNRMVDVQIDGETHKLAQYNAVTCTPRPESYYEDFMLAANIADEAQKRKLYTGLKSAAESGWDFSSRHFRASDGSNRGTLINTETQSLIFVELNCILHANAVVLSEWYRYFGHAAKSQYYRGIANKLMIAIDKVFWNEQVGIWLDYDPSLGKHRNYFYPTNLTPLWTGSYTKKARYAERAIRYLQSEGIIKFNLSPTYFGVPNSKVNTTEQWDFPNCWAPLQAIVIQGLERTNHPVARFISFKMAQSWIHTTYAGFIEHGYMFEKYSAVDLGRTGSGGEYAPAKGFGWTNGFNMELLNTWGRYLKSEPN